MSDLPQLLQLGGCRAGAGALFIKYDKPGPANASGEVQEGRGRRRPPRTARGVAQVSISSPRQLVGGDGLPPIKPGEAGARWAHAAGPRSPAVGGRRGGRGQRGGGGEEGGQAGAPRKRWPLRRCISRQSDTVIYGGVIFYCCRYWRWQSTSRASRVLSIIAAISQVVKAINRGIRPILESHY